MRMSTLMEPGTIFIKKKQFETFHGVNPLIFYLNDDIQFSQFGTTKFRLVYNGVREVRRVVSMYSTQEGNYAIINKIK